MVVVEVKTDRSDEGTISAAVVLAVLLSRLSDRICASNGYIPVQLLHWK